MKRHDYLLPLAAPLPLLLVPLVAMQFSTGVNWSPLDFLVAWLLLGGTALGLRGALRRSARPAYRIGAAVALGAGLMLVWANLAVGVVGDESNPANLMYFAVPLVGLGGAAIARFRAEGMARAMYATAFAQALAGVVAWLVRPDEMPWIILVAHAVFVALFTGSAWLFQRAASTPLDRAAA